MLVQRNLAGTIQPARPVLQTEITSVCVVLDLLAMIVKTVGNTPMQLTNNGFWSLKTWRIWEGGGVEI